MDLMLCQDTCFSHSAISWGAQTPGCRLHMLHLLHKITYRLHSLHTNYIHVTWGRALTFNETFILWSISGPTNCCTMPFDEYFFESTYAPGTYASLSIEYWIVPVLPQGPQAVVPRSRKLVWHRRLEIEISSHKSLMIHNYLTSHFFKKLI
jgi:hypothetical protein